MRLDQNWEIAVPSRSRSGGSRMKRADSIATQAWLRSAKLDRLKMHRLRSALAESDLAVSRLTDDELIAAASARLVMQHLAVEPPEPPAPEAPSQRPMSGYFTTLKWIRGKSLDELENRIGYRTERLTSKGALIYRFLRLPELNEFEVSGYSVTTKSSWDAQVAPERAKELAKSAAYHQATKVPSFDEVQRRNAREAMGLAGQNMLVKVYPVDWQPVDDTPSGYRTGTGIPQWRLTPAVYEQKLIQGQLLYTVAPGNNVPAG